MGIVSDDGVKTQLRRTNPNRRGKLSHKVCSYQMAWRNRLEIESPLGGMTWAGSTWKKKQIPEDITC